MQSGIEKRFLWWLLLQAKLWELGFRNVAGVDEAGRGPLAGPVVAAACIIPASATIPGKTNTLFATSNSDH
jgi:ribonuclease HII